MVAWVPAITLLSPMGTVLAVHHRRNVGGGNVIKQKHNIISTKEMRAIQ